MDKEEIDDNLLFDLVRDASFQGEIDDPTVSGTLSNPLCGDEVTFYVLLGENLEVKKIRFRTKGCFICKATAAALAKLSSEKKVLEILASISKFREEFVSGAPDSSGIYEFKILHGLRSYPTRAKCVLLPFETLFTIMDKI